MDVRKIMRKSIMMLGAIAAVFLMVSTATALPNIKNTEKIKSIIEMRNNIVDNDDDKGLLMWLKIILHFILHWLCTILGFGPIMRLLRALPLISLLFDIFDEYMPQ